MRAYGKEILLARDGAYATNLLCSSKRRETPINDSRNNNKKDNSNKFQQRIKASGKEIPLTL